MQALTQITSKKVPTWSKEFDTLVRGIGECKSKAEEDAIITREIELLKPRLKDPKLDKRSMKELLVRLIYVEMLGHDAGWAHVKALQACSDGNLVAKKVAYLASTLFLDHRNDTIILVVNTLQSDLKSENFAVVCTALFAVCKLINCDLINAVLPQVVDLLAHPKELVRKKAIMALHRFQQLDPGHDGALHGVDLDRHFRQMLCDKDPSVMAAALCALYETVKQDPKPYRNLIPSFVSILKQVAEHRLPKTYEYHKTPAPFIQLKLLQILSVLGTGDKAASEHMYTIVAEVMRRGNTGHTIGNAIVYECVRTITTIYPNPPLLQSAAEMIASFLKAPSHNLKYVGIESLSRIVRINPKYAQEHQMAVIECLEDPDVTLKKKTLELLYKMTKPDNVEVIVEKMLEYLRGTTDEIAKADVCKRISELAESYAPDTSWFISTMNQVFEMGGDVVQPQLAQNLMTLIAEGGGEEGDDDNGLRVEAVESYLQLLEKAKLPQILLQVIAWVLGEYGHLAAQGGSAVMDKLAGMIAQYKVDDVTRGYILTALAKLCVHSGKPLTSEAHEIVQAALGSRNTDIQQRAAEVLAVARLPPQTSRAALPEDAVVEEVQVDESLPFLNAFVQAALAAGAAPYIPEAERIAMGVVRQSAQEGASQSNSHHSAPLRFEAYETAKPPSAVAVQHDPFAPAVDIAFAAAQPGAGGMPWGSQQNSGHEAIQSASAVVAAAAPAAAMASSSGLRVQAGAKKWGPARFDATPVSPPPTSSGSRTGPAPSLAPVPAPAAVPSRQPVQAEEVNPHKQKLAQSLFGGSASSGAASSSRTATARIRAGAPAKPRNTSLEAAAPSVTAAAPSAAPSAMDLLLDLDAAPAAPSVAAAHAPADPFAALEQLSTPAPVPAATASKPALTDLLGNMPATGAPQYLPGLGAMPVPAGVPHPGLPAGLPGVTGFAGAGMVPMMTAGAPYGVQGAAPNVVMHGVPGVVQNPVMAAAASVPAAGAAPKPQAKDPFADLFG